MPLGIAEPIRRAIGPTQAGGRQGAGVPAVGLHLARTGPLLDPDVGEAFGSADAVNRALRALTSHIFNIKRHTTIPFQCVAWSATSWRTILRCGMVSISFPASLRARSRQWR